MRLAKITRVGILHHYVRLFSESPEPPEPAVEVPVPGFTGLHGSVESMVPRPRHVEMLKTIFSGTPQVVTTVLGPVNVGKSTILRHALAGRPVATLALKKTPVRTVDDFNRMLQRQFSDWASPTALLNTIQTRLGGTKLLGFEVPELKGEEDSFVAFERLLIAIEESLVRAKKALGKDPTYLPVIYIEGGDRLRALMDTPGGSNVLELFFRWCAYITNTMHLAHVVMSSSDGLFVRWLQEQFELQDFLQTVYITDLGKERALDYMRSLLENVPEVYQPVNYDYIYERLGGRVRDIAIVFAHVPLHNTISGAVRSQTSLCKSRVLEALNPHLLSTVAGGAAQWTPGQWWSTLVAVDKGDGEASFHDLRQTVFQRNPGGLESLIRHGLLCYQPPDSLCTRIREKMEPLVTFPRPAFLAATRAILRNPPEVLLHVRVRQVDGGVISVTLGNFSVEALEEAVGLDNCFQEIRDEDDNLIQTDEAVVLLRWDELLTVVVP